ncbi:Transposase (or an inactivated derivative) [Syntrophus gentianae]|uniref:Mutator family transposase n=1 Tax=Syntrophus gentianae TaxID=43775 RepID=A0A1H7YQ45_9BACT|nr:IS256 family transposase [Syntrophus gentianae]SEM47428.1 Transposase (or an inactivated derivative) [Syntrophus gentianae]
MENNERDALENQVKEESKSALELIIREGACRMLQAAIENEITEYIDFFRNEKDSRKRRLVVRNGSLPEREIVTGIGPLKIKQPRILDKREGQHFTSNILPRYMRRIPSVDALVPALYLKGISTGDFSRVLESILGKNASGLSATNIVRLKRLWELDYKHWSGRDLSCKRYVYFWADGIYFNVRLEDAENKRQCILILIGTLENGKKELVSVLDGYRESKQAWQEILGDLKHRGLKAGPKLAVGDGGLGFWAALREEFPETVEQRCWVHKTANILDKMPKSVQPRAKAHIREMYMAPTKKEAFKAYSHFLSQYQAKYENACTCLEKDKENLFAFYDFPAEHWRHIRSTNPIESTFATVRLRTHRTKGCGSRLATLTMVFKLAMEAEKTWQKIRGHHLICKVIEGIRFVDGLIMQEAA